ncbi:MAG: DUF3280 domain-containing protein [Candidatus Eremiobacteraeota bacterium]|nr:DUF3280 domain-containing protein [Candidatus Eremiobacteraeota bacterium]
MRAARLVLASGFMIWLLGISGDDCNARASVVSPARPKVVAVLPLAPVSTDMPYAPLPSPRQLASLTHELRLAIATPPHIVLIDQARTTRELRSRSYQQDSSSQSCADNVCARQIGLALGATTVVYGGVTRLMAVIWSTDVLVVDVRSGVVLGEVTAGYKGDYNSMLMGEHFIGARVVKLIAAGPHKAKIR